MTRSQELTHLFDVFVHEFFVKVVPETVVDEGCFCLVRFCSRAILEDNVVIPPLSDLHVTLGTFGVLVLEKRVPCENVFHSYPLLLFPLPHLPLLSFLSLLSPH